jgi:protein subunit release factor B
MDTDITSDSSTERDALERETDVTFFVAGGPGGQHRNKVETGVRLLHRPTGIVVAATERRSQAANRDAAFERLAERLGAMRVVRKQRRATRPTLASQARRRERKQQRSNVKQQRRPVRDE